MSNHKPTTSKPLLHYLISLTVWAFLLGSLYVSWNWSTIQHQIPEWLKSLIRVFANLSIFAYAIIGTWEKAKKRGNYFAWTLICIGYLYTFASIINVAKNYINLPAQITIQPLDSSYNTLGFGLILLLLFGALTVDVLIWIASFDKKRPDTSSTQAKVS